tara:strand:+ start:676 stop:969 length:294 start_codon:yes stop_codon:yes gene_type:complete
MSDFTPQEYYIEFRNKLNWYATQMSNALNAVEAGRQHKEALQIKVNRAKRENQPVQEEWLKGIAGAEWCMEIMQEHHNDMVKQLDKYTREALSDFLY